MLERKKITYCKIWKLLSICLYARCIRHAKC